MSPAQSGDIDVRRSESSLAIPSSWECIEASNGTRWGWLDSRLVVDVGDVQAVVTEGTIDVFGDCSPDLVAHLLAVEFVPRLISLRGDVVLHGGGFVDAAGRAVAYVGPSGVGKSTLTASLQSMGIRTLADDMLRISMLDPWTAFDAGAPYRLLHDSATHLGLSASSIGPDGKHLIAPSSRASVLPAPLEAIVILERTSGSTRLERLPFATAFPLIAESTVPAAASREAWLRTGFDKAAQLASDVPVFGYNLPNDLDRCTTSAAEFADAVCEALA